MQNILRIIKISKPLHHLVVILCVLIILSSALNLVAPILSKYIVDDIVAKLQGHGGNLDHLIFLIGLAFVTNLAGLILTVAVS